MAKFFRFCTRCDKFFQSQEAWDKHLSDHVKKRNLKPVEAFDEVEKRSVIESSIIPGADISEIEDLRLAKTKGLRKMKSELKAAGIECATMNAKEAKEAYAKAVAEGKVIEDDRTS